MAKKKDLMDTLQEYVKKFDDMFPIAYVSGTDDEIQAMIQECIDKNRPYEEDLEKDELM